MKPPKIMQQLSCSSNITLSLTAGTVTALCRELNFHNGYLSLLYFWPQVQCKSNYVKASRRRLLCTHLCDHYAPLITLTSSKRSKALDRLCTRLNIMTFLTLLPTLDQYPQRLSAKVEKQHVQIIFGISCKLLTKNQIFKETSLF